MGKASVEYKEIRFVIDEELTHVYVFCEAIGDCPIGVQGWHKKTFPASKNVLDILNNHMFQGDNDESDPILWGIEAPKKR